MPWHHIIPKHEWKKRFGNLVGVDAPDNLVDLTLEQHIEVHRRMADEGSGYDKIAYQAMSGMMGKEEAFMKIVSQPKPHSHRMAIRNALLGIKHSPARIEKNRISHLTQTFSTEHRRKISMGNKGHSKPTIMCPYCGKIGGCNVMPRYHFNNCKRKGDNYGKATSG